MGCDFCSNDASIEIVVFIDGEARTIKMCPNCYREKLEEMMDNIPQEWGGELLNQQLQSMLDKVESEGGLFEGIEFKVTRDVENNEEKFTIERSSKSLDEEEQNTRPQRSARDLSLSKQRKNLRRQRTKKMQELEMALDQEDYEYCAFLRDEITRIGDELVNLNEERKNPYGV